MLPCDAWRRSVAHAACMPEGQRLPAPLCTTVSHAGSDHAAGSASQLSASAAIWPTLHSTPQCSGVTMGETLQRLGPSLELTPMQQSAFVKPHSIMYQLDGE